MDIVCTGCQKPLRVPDHAAGREARCPACSTMVLVPLLAEAVDNRRPLPPKLGDDAMLRMLLPVGRSWWAIAAGYAGLFAVICFPAPIALILGLVAIWDIKSHPEKHGLGRAVFGLVMGILGSVGLIWVLLGAGMR